MQPKTLSTNGAYIKYFFKWLNNSDEYPSNVKWIKTSVKNKNRKLPTDLLTLDEIKAMAKAGNPMERAFIMVLYESACRIGEILNLKIKDVSIDQYGSALMVDGKTGMRRIRLIDSSPDLVMWIDKHPKKHERNSYLFIQNHSKTDCKGLTDVGTILKNLVMKTGIKKHVHPHLFRHSRLTELARDFSESELKVIAGWSGNSNMAGVYIHLSGGDIEKKMLERRGLLNKENDSLTLERVTVKQGVIVSPDQGVTVSPDQKVTVSPGQGVTVSLDQRVTVSPDQGVTVSPDQRATVSPGQRMKVSPDQRATVSPGQRVKVSPDRRIKRNFRRVNRNS